LGEKGFPKRRSRKENPKTVINLLLQFKDLDASPQKINEVF